MVPCCEVDGCLALNTNAVVHGQVIAGVGAVPRDQIDRAAGNDVLAHGERTAGRDVNTAVGRNAGRAVDRADGQRSVVGYLDAACAGIRGKRVNAGLQAAASTDACLCQREELGPGHTAPAVGDGSRGGLNTHQPVRRYGTVDRDAVVADHDDAGVVLRIAGGEDSEGPRTIEFHEDVTVPAADVQSPCDLDAEVLAARANGIVDVFGEYGLVGNLPRLVPGDDRRVIGRQADGHRLISGIGHLDRVIGQLCVRVELCRQLGLGALQILQVLRQDFVGDAGIEQGLVNDSNPRLERRCRGQKAPVTGHGNRLSDRAGDVQDVHCNRHRLHRPIHDVYRLAEGLHPSGKLVHVSGYVIQLLLLGIPQVDLSQFRLLQHERRCLARLKQGQFRGRFRILRVRISDRVGGVKLGLSCRGRSAANREAVRNDVVRSAVAVEHHTTAGKHTDISAAGVQQADGYVAVGLDRDIRVVRLNVTDDGDGAAAVRRGARVDGDHAGARSDDLVVRIEEDNVARGGAQRERHVGQQLGFVVGDVKNGDVVGDKRAAAAFESGFGDRDGAVVGNSCVPAGGELVDPGLEGVADSNAAGCRDAQRIRLDVESRPVGVGDFAATHDHDVVALCGHQAKADVACGSDFDVRVRTDRLDRNQIQQRCAHGLDVDSTVGGWHGQRPDVDVDGPVDARRAYARAAAQNERIRQDVEAGSVPVSDRPAAVHRRRIPGGGDGMERHLASVAQRKIGPGCGGRRQGQIAIVLQEETAAIGGG